MAANELEYASTNPNALDAFKRDLDLHSQHVDLLQLVAAPESNRKIQDPAQVLYSKVDRALSNTFFGSATPDTATLEKCLTTANSAERQALQQTYSDTKHKTILQEMARVYGPASQDYHHLKGLLLRNDSPASMAAVDLHMRLMQIDKQAKDIDRADKGTSTGFWNNIIDNNEFDPGTQGTIDAFSSLAGSLAKGAANKDLSKTLGALNAKDLQELKSEHLRIYRRDIGDMVENTNGLSDAARESFNKLCIN